MESRDSTSFWKVINDFKNRDSSVSDQGSNIAPDAWFQYFNGLMNAKDVNESTMPEGTCTSPSYAPNFEKEGSILLSACPSVRPSVQKKFKARVLKFHIWIPHQKIAYPYFFSCPNYLPLPSYAPSKG